MIARVLSRRETVFRKIVAISLLRWNLQLGLALSRADGQIRALNRRAARPPTLPDHLRNDVGLPPVAERKEWWAYR